MRKITLSLAALCAAGAVGASLEAEIVSKTVAGGEYGPPAVAPARPAPETTAQPQRLGRQQVCGRVRGYATPGTRPIMPCPFVPDDCECCPQDTPCADPVLTDLPGVRVEIDGGGYAYTAADGTFCIDHEGQDYITVRASLDDGEYVYVVDDSGADVLEASLTDAPAAYFDLELNTTPDEVKTAQVNAFLAANLSYNFWLNRTDDFSPLENGQKLKMLVNSEAQSCGLGKYLSDDIGVKTRLEGACDHVEPTRNCAFNVSIAHEFGHFVLDRYIEGDLNTDIAFCEGFCDSFAYLLFDTPTFGDWGFLTGEYFRDTEERNMQYPCSGATNQCGAPFQHDCGQILSGAWWDIRKNFGVTYGSEAGLESARALFVEWAQSMNGSDPTFAMNSAYPGTLIEVLTADDALPAGDNDLSNGTPNDEDIYAAFAKHGICWTYYTCPGDFDCDGVVGLSDLAEMLANYGQIPEGATYADGDMDGDGEIDLSDLAAFLSVYNTVCD